MAVGDVHAQGETGSNLERYAHSVRGGRSCTANLNSVDQPNIDINYSFCLLHRPSASVTPLPTDSE